MAKRSYALLVCLGAVTFPDLLIYPVFTSTLISLSSLKATRSQKQAGLNALKTLYPIDSNSSETLSSDIAPTVPEGISVLPVLPQIDAAHFFLQSGEKEHTFWLKYLLLKIAPHARHVTLYHLPLLIVVMPLL